MEEWREVFKNIIPKGTYETLLSFGEKEGLLIKLISKKNIIYIEFGYVVVFRIFDEGIILNALFEESQIEKYKKDKFSNIIYKIQNGDFDKFVKQIGNELYEYLDLKHYIIVTINYVIEVITEWEPRIKVVEIAKNI